MDMRELSPFLLLGGLVFLIHAVASPKDRSLAKWAAGGLFTAAGIAASLPRPNSRSC